MSDPTQPLSEMPGLAVRPMGGLRRAGRLLLRPTTTLVTLIGGMDLDLTQAVVPPGGARITKVSLVGGVSVVTGRDVRVDVGGFTFIGDRDVERLPDVPPGAPVLRIRAWGVVGGVRVRVAA